MLPEVVAQSEAEGHLSCKLVFLDEAGVFLSRQFLFQLQVVVPESYRTHPCHRNHRQQHIAVIELGPEQRTDEGRAEDDQSAHRWRPSFLLMRVRRAFADHLMEAHSAEAPHDSRADDECQKERGNRSTGGAESYPLEQSQKPEMRQSYE